MNHALQVKKEDLVIGSRLSGDQDLNFDELEVRGACTPAALHLLLRERLPGVAPPPSRTSERAAGCSHTLALARVQLCQHAQLLTHVHVSVLLGQAEECSQQCRLQPLRG